MENIAHSVQDETVKEGMLRLYFVIYPIMPQRDSTQIDTIWKVSEGLRAKSMLPLPSYWSAKHDALRRRSVRQNDLYIFRRISSCHSVSCKD